MIEQLLLETFFGGLTGYVTNDVAIKGLFKKGGVVEKTRDEFIHEASALLEEQVLTQEVLRERLTLEAVEAAMDELLRHFFRCEMPDVLRAKTWGGVAGYDELWPSIQAELTILWQQASPALADILLEQLSLEQLLPASQQEMLAEKILAVLQAELVQGGYGGDFLKRWLERAGEQSGEALGLAELTHSAAGQAVHLLQEWLKALLTSSDEAVLELLQTAWTRLAVPELLEELEQSLRVRPLADFCPGGAKELAQAIDRYLDS